MTEEKGRIKHSLICPPSLCSLLCCCPSKGAPKASSAIHACLHFPQQFVSPASSPVNKQAAPSQACCFQPGKNHAGSWHCFPHPIFQPSFPQERLDLFSAQHAPSRAQSLSCHISPVLSHTCSAPPAKAGAQQHRDTQHVPRASVLPSHKDQNKAEGSQFEGWERGKAAIKPSTTSQGCSKVPELLSSVGNTPVQL